MTPEQLERYRVFTRYYKMDTQLATLAAYWPDLTWYVRKRIYYTMRWKLIIRKWQARWLQVRRWAGSGYL